MWILIVLIAAGIGIYYYFKNKPKKDDRPEAPPCNTVEDYIRLESTEKLKHIARDLFRFIYFNLYGTETIYIPSKNDYFVFTPYGSFETRIGYSSWKNHPSIFTYKVPENLLNEAPPNAVMALKILEERGEDPNAGFLLGIIYEFGLIDDIHADVEEAKKHYEIAKEQGSKLVGLLEILRRKWLVPDGICEDKNEVIFVNMTPNRLKAIADAELKNYYNDYCRSSEYDVRLAATLGLVHYQEIRSPLSSALIGIFADKGVDVSDAISIGDFCSYNERDAMSLRVRVWDAARRGNPYASVVCQTFNIRF